jgi:hypothetical protein
VGSNTTRANRGIKCTNFFIELIRITFELIQFRLGLRDGFRCGRARR